MARTRKALIALGSMPHCHICVRAVRQGSLCGEDCYSSRNFDPRKQWREDELLRLSEIFAIDLTALGAGIASTLAESDHTSINWRIDT